MESLWTVDFPTGGKQIHKFFVMFNFDEAQICAVDR